MNEVPAVEGDGTAVAVATAFVVADVAGGWTWGEGLASRAQFPQRQVGPCECVYRLLCCICAKTGAATVETEETGVAA